MGTCLRAGTTSENFGKNPVMRQALIREVITKSQVLGKLEISGVKDLVVTHELFRMLANSGHEPRICDVFLSLYTLLSRATYLSRDEF
jgi:hypothetical protein